MARLLIAVTLLAFVAVALADKDAELSKLKSLLKKVEQRIENEVEKKQEETKPVVARSKKAVVLKAKSLLMKAKAAHMQMSQDAEKDGKSFSNIGSGDFSGWDFSGMDWDFSGMDWDFSGDFSGMDWGFSGDFSYMCDATGPDECCLWQTDMCDGWDDCNGWDEEPINCGDVCANTEGFSCTSGHCIPSYWKCDNWDDCGTGEDEVDCAGSGSGNGSGSGHGPNGHGPSGSGGHCNCGCAPEDLQCDGECYPDWYVCDEYPDCMDGSDEMGCAKKSAKELMYSKAKSFTHQVKKQKAMSYDDKLAYALKDFATSRTMTLKDVAQALAKIQNE